MVVDFVVDLVVDLVVVDVVDEPPLQAPSAVVCLIQSRKLVTLI